MHHGVSESGEASDVSYADHADHFGRRAIAPYALSLFELSLLTVRRGRQRSNRMVMAFALFANVAKMVVFQAAKISLFSQRYPQTAWLSHAIFTDFRTLFHLISRVRKFRN